MAAVQSTSADNLFATLNAAREQTRSKETDPQDRFLKLLVTQLKNQDPLNPMDNQQMTSQLAQISTVDGIERLNATLKALTESADKGQAMQAAALVGRGVLVPGSGLAMANGMALGGVELEGPADSVTVTIKDANGIAMRTLDLGPRAAGSHSFSWDGKTDAGVPAAEGGYTIAVKARQGNNEVKATALEFGVVSSVSRNGGGIALNVGLLGSFKLDDVREII